MRAIGLLLLALPMLASCASPDLVCADQAQRKLQATIDELNSPEMDAAVAAAQKGAPQ